MCLPSSFCSLPSSLSIPFHNALQRFFHLLTVTEYDKSNGPVFLLCQAQVFGRVSTIDTLSWTGAIIPYLALIQALS